MFLVFKKIREVQSFVIDSIKCEMKLSMIIFLVWAKKVIQWGILQKKKSIDGVTSSTGPTKGGLVTFWHNVKMTVTYKTTNNVKVRPDVCKYRHLFLLTWTHVCLLSCCINWIILCFVKIRVIHTINNLRFYFFVFITLSSKYACRSKFLNFLIKLVNNKKNIRFHISPYICGKVTFILIKKKTSVTLFFSSLMWIFLSFLFCFLWKNLWQDVAL